MAKFINHYDCPACGTHWHDASDCTNDDRCPNCDLSCSPSDTEDGGDAHDFTVGDRVEHDGRVGVIRHFRSFTEDGERFTFAGVEFPGGEVEGIDVDELDPA